MLVVSRLAVSRGTNHPDTLAQPVALASDWTGSWLILGQLTRRKAVRDGAINVESSVT